MPSVFARSLNISKNYISSISSLLRITIQIRRKHTCPIVSYDMNQVLLRHNKDNEVFDITFRLILPDLKVDRQLNFSRQESESVGIFLQKVDNRIKSIVNKKVNKKKKVAELDDLAQTILRNDNVQTNKIALLKNDTKVDDNEPLASILQNVLQCKLFIFDSSYEIRVNVPNVLNVSLPKSILVGYPTYPCKFETEYVDKQKSTFVWYKNDTLSQKTTAWEQVAKGYLYIPSMNDIGAKIKLSCIPRNDEQVGPKIEVESPGIVATGPCCPFETRHNYTKEKLSGKSFRITSYNILANIYAGTDYSQEVLFPYCPEHALNIDYRKQLILKELMGFNSDLICLQEVDHTIFNNDLMPLLSVLNYDGEYTAKKDTREGLATFFNTARFDKISFESTVVGQNTDLKKFNEVWSAIKNEKAKVRFQERNTTLQITGLRSKENPTEILLIGNTHLYFKPDADHIRLLQAYYILLYLHDLVKRTIKEYPECEVSIILCGDFNSTPESGIYQLVTDNYISTDCQDWKSNAEEAIENVSLYQDFQLHSACGIPETTNYTPMFSGCLDYIFYEPHRLMVQQVVPMPSVKELSLYEGLPNEVYPSDHISLCADLKWIV